MVRCRKGRIFPSDPAGAGIDDRNGRGRTGTDGDHFLDIDITVSAGYCNRLEAGGCLYIAGEIPVIQLLSNAPVS